jgi:hypothetical protein
VVNDENGRVGPNPLQHMNVIEGSHTLSKVVDSRFKENGKKGEFVECIRNIIIEVVRNLLKEEYISKLVSKIEGVVWR